MPQSAAAPATPDMPKDWRTQAGPQADITADWWKGFGDPILTAWVEDALANNLDIATAVARVREARAQEVQARSQLFPSLDASLGASRARTLNAFGKPSETFTLQPTFQAAYELDLFGRIASGVDAARLAGDATEVARDAAALSVASATASGYITLRALDARLMALQETIESRQEAVRIARRRAEAGYTSDLELRQSEAEYESTVQQVPQVRLAIERQEHALALLTGHTPETIPRGKPLAGLVPPPVPAGLPSELLRRRPDIAQAEYTLASSDATLAAARAQFLPQIRLSASVGQLRVSQIDPLTVWSIGASVLAPIFNAGRIQSQVDAASARREQAALSYRRTVLTALREVEDNLSAVSRTREQRLHIQAQRSALAEALRHAENRYRAGYSSYLEQLDAQRGLLSADLALIQASSDELTSLVALMQAMGGGWDGKEAMR